MSVIWHKVWFDLWRNKIRTGLAVLSVTAGVFAIGTMFGMSDKLLTNMDAAHQANVPSHMSLYTDAPVDRNLAASLQDIPGVAAVEPINEMTVLYKIRPEDEWKPARVIARSDYERQMFDLSTLEAGRWPAKGGIGVERLSSEYYGLGIGDQVIFKVGKSDKTLPITGMLHHSFVEPPMFGGSPVFFMDGQDMARFGIPDGYFVGLLVRITPYNADDAKEVATQIKARLTKAGIGVPMATYQDPALHWGRQYVEGITLALQVLAVAVSLSSVMLVSNTVMALVTQQTDQIGILRAIGGKKRTIIQVYLTCVMAYGVLSLLIALPAGAVTAFGMTRMVLRIFNIDYETFQVSSQALVLQMLAATLVPLLAGLWPVLQAAAMTVREAIATYGLGGDFGSNRFDRAVERLGARLLPSRYAIALGNLFRRKRRLLLAQAALVMAGTMFLSVMSLSASVTATVDQEFSRRRYDATVDLAANQRTDRILSMALSVEGVEKAELWTVQSARRLRRGQLIKEAGVGSQIVGVPDNSDTYRPLIVAGRWLQPGDTYIVVMNEKTALNHHIQLGDWITLDLGALEKKDWQVIGFYRSIGGDPHGADALYAAQSSLFQALNKYNLGTLLYVSTQAHTQANAEQVASRLQILFEARNIKVTESKTVYRQKSEVSESFDISLMMLLFLAVIMAVVGGLGLTGALSISVIERTKEIGMLRAIGARSGAIQQMFVLEGVLQGLFSWALAIPLSLVASPPFSDALGQELVRTRLSFEYNYATVLVWLAVILVISTLASILPARNATRVSVRASLAYA